MTRLSEIEHMFAQLEEGAEFDDAPLSQEARELLAYDLSPSFLDDLEPRCVERGDTLGGWTLGPLLGTGGMGMVFEAWRSVEDITQRGALKVATTWHRGRVSIRRFELERRLLARASGHPNLAGFLDAGVGAHGELYVVTQLVEGSPLLDAVEAQGLRRRAQVRALRDLTRAVAHLHQCGLVHRDIKPSNVLLDAQGIAHLLDLGIARDLLAPQGDLTREGEMCMTPTWAAPEQLLGEEVTTLTDIYAIGWLGCALLGGGAHAGARASSDPLRPRVDLLEELAARQRLEVEVGDVDLNAILSRACRMNPQERYVTADALLRDLECWLSGDPAEARRGYRRLQTRRWLGRMWHVLLLGVLLSVGASVGVHRLYVSLANQPRAKTPTQTITETAGYREASKLERVLDDVVKRKETIQELSFAHDGEWVVVTSQRFTSSSGYPSEAKDVAKTRWSMFGEVVDELAVNQAGEYILITNKGLWSNLSSEPRLSVLEDFAKRYKGQLDDITFDSDGEGWFIASGTQSFSSNMPDDFYQGVLETRRSRRPIRAVSMNRLGGWAIVTDDGLRASGVTSEFRHRLELWRKRGLRLAFVHVNAGDGYVWASHGDGVDVLSDLEPSTRP